MPGNIMFRFKPVFCKRQEKMKKKGKLTYTNYCCLLHLQTSAYYVPFYSGLVLALVQWGKNRLNTDKNTNDTVVSEGNKAIIYHGN